MEMGVQIESGDHTGKVVDLFEELIRGNILRV
jgi:hypothetical protein